VAVEVADICMSSAPELVGARDLFAAVISTKKVNASIGWAVIYFASETPTALNAGPPAFHRIWFG
jgi:hypothetical protein